jgi:GPH family glycoside/pentoside/hexuronide:cation symporter
MPSPQSEKLHLTTKLAYGAGDFGPAVAANILVFYLLFFFTDVAGLSPGLAGSILMIGKISDAINDPIVGIWSDRTRSRWGRRLPWILIGITPFTLLYCLQWTVPQFSGDRIINQWGLFAYYVLIGIGFNLAYTMVNLPYTALTPELTEDYNERTSLNSFRFTFSIGGSILSLILAGLIFNAFPGSGKTRFLVLGLACGVLGVIALLWCISRIQERGQQPILKAGVRRSLSRALMFVAIALAIASLIQLLNGSLFWGIYGLLITVFAGLWSYTLRDTQTEPHLMAQEANELSSASTVPFSEQLKIVFRNRPFLYVIGIYLCAWLGVQLTASILIYFVVSWMRMPESSFPLIAIAVQGTALVMLFVWRQVSDRFGKKAVYFMGMSLWIVAQVGLYGLQPGQIGWLYGLAILAGCGVSVAYLIPWSMVPDVIELDELETGQRREGVFYAFMVLLQKFGLALGLFLVGIVLQAAGFVEQIPGKPVPIQPDSALNAIRFAIAPLPALILSLGMVLAYFYPITKDYHQEIRLKLQEKRALNPEKEEN